MALVCVCLIAFSSSITRTASFPWSNTDLVVEKSPDFPADMTLMGKGLEKIPKGSPQVRTVNFAYNHISYLPPYVFYDNFYQILQKIELHQNKISNISYQAFRELKQLKSVDLSGNNITSIEANTFRQNTELEKLDLSNNRLRFHPEKPFLHSRTLQTLVLSDNKIDQIYEVTFVKLHNLRNLMMDNNAISRVSPNGFAHLAHLQYLSLANTGVDTLSGSMFSTLPRILDITDTPLANKFAPPLKKVKNDVVMKLIYVEKYIFDGRV